MATYREFHRQSVDDRDAFWRDEAKLIDWQTPFSAVLDYSRPPFAKWYVGGRTNICHNAIDRHLAARGGQTALIYISTETGQQRTYTFRELHGRGEPFAAVLKAQGVGRGDRVLIYMPMIAEAMFAMLACARIGAIHSVVFGGFAAASLATRIDDARPKVMVTSDAGMRGGKPVPYKHLVDESIRLAQYPPASVIIVNRGLDRGDERRRRPRPRLRGAARAAHRRAGAVRMARIERTVVHPVHVGDHRQARRACSATPAATRSRWRRRCAGSSASSPARRCSPPATSAGSSATRTSSTAR